MAPERGRHPPIGTSQRERVSLRGVRAAARHPTIGPSVLRGCLYDVGRWFTCCTKTYMCCLSCGCHSPIRCITQFVCNLRTSVDSRTTLHKLRTICKMRHKLPNLVGSQFDGNTCSRHVLLLFKKASLPVFRAPQESQLGLSSKYKQGLLETNSDVVTG